MHEFKCIYLVIFLIEFTISYGIMYIRGVDMSLMYKFDILEKLKECGYTTYRIRQENLFSQSTLQKFRRKQMVSSENIEILCRLLDCQPGDIMEYVPDDEEN